MIKLLKNIFILLFAVTVTAGVYEARADETVNLSVEQIVKKTNLAAYYAGKDGMAKVKMTIADKEGNERKREFKILRLDKEDGGDQKFYVYFERPSDVRKMVYMVWKHTKKEDDRWMYLPALDLVRRIAAGDRRSSFVGSHFVYEDVSGRSPDEDNHELVKEDKNFFILKNIPKQPDTVEFSYFTIKIDRKTFIPVLAEYFDREGKKYRTVEALEIKEFSGYPCPLPINNAGHLSFHAVYSSAWKLKIRLNVDFQNLKPLSIYEICSIPTMT